jgi:hypothetical protein
MGSLLEGVRTLGVRRGARYAWKMCFWDMRGRLGMLMREEGLGTYRYNTNHDTTRNERCSNITLSFLTTGQDRSVEDTMLPNVSQVSLAVCGWKHSRLSDITPPILTSTIEMYKAGRTLSSLSGWEVRYS